MSLNNNTSELQAILEAVRALPEAGSGGVELPTLTNPATGDDIVEGKEAIDKDGFRITGVIPAKAAASVTASGAVVTVPRGYYSADVQKSVSTTAQATPVISVSTGGLITATSTQGEGYVASGTKSATRQLTVQAAATIVPNTTTQTAVASGRYTTGAVTVSPIPSEYVKPSGTKSITANGTHDVKLYESVSVNVSQAAPTLQTKTATPTESQQSVTPDSGYDGLSKVTVNAIPEGYLVGEEITAQDALITQIQNALQGKAAGGGGGSVETCTVTIQTILPCIITYTSVNENGEIYGEYLSTTAYVHYDLTAICGSSVSISAVSSSLESHINIKTTKATMLYRGNYCAVLSIDAASGESASITMHSSGGGGE